MRGFTILTAVLAVLLAAIALGAPAVALAQQVARPNAG